METNCLLNYKLTRIWANDQRNARPIEYRWRPVLNAAVWLSPTARVLRSNAPNRTAQDLEDAVNFAPGKIPLRGNSRQKCIHSLQPR